MLFLAKLKGFHSNHFILVPLKLSSVLTTPLKLPYCSQPISETTVEIDRIIKLINDHPFPASPLRSTLLQKIPADFLSTMFVENVLGRLYAANSNSLKVFEFFKYSLHHSKFRPSSDAFEKTLHILLRMRYFNEAWELMEEIRKRYPTLLTLKSMSIMLSRVAKFQSYEDTLRAFEKMEKDIFVGREFGTAEFNVLLQAFCTQQHIKEAHSVLEKMRSRFYPNTTTLNILLLGFRESKDIAAMELFYHGMVRRGFKPNNVTYTIRIGAFCKKGFVFDGLRLLEEMERVNCSPTLGTFTVLIQGAGVARNSSKAWQLFEEICKKNLQPDRGVYNALISSLAKSNDVKSAFRLMGEMDDRNIGLDDSAFHAMFLGLMTSDGIDGICILYKKMIKNDFMPSTQTVVTLMRIFCQNSRTDLGLHLWGYLMERGYCPHRCALDLLVAALCSQGRVQEALECSIQMLERGIHISEGSFCLLERFLRKAGKTYLLRMLDDRIKRLRPILPPSMGHA